MNCSTVVRSAILISRDLMLQKNENGDTTLTGFEGIFLYAILKAFHRKIELVIAEDNEVGRPLPNGSWTGMIGLAQRGDADMFAALLAKLSVPSDIPTVKNFAELSSAVSKRGFKAFIVKGAATLNLLKNSENEYLRRLGQAINRHKWYTDIHTPLLKHSQIDTDSALLGVQTNLQMIAGQEQWKHHFLSDDSINTFPIAVAMKKNFCYKRKLNAIISHLNSAGIYRKITSEGHFRNWLSFSGKRRVVYKEKKALSLEFLSGPFMMLLFGLISGLIALFCEIYMSKMLKVSNMFY
ncbi:hypothetical protein AVEN_261316-1 [Araneus ventricosus]|uniref:Ionotropic glutamate receptor L-glutamate and glycine-binding domain-containing protein n=1 Tax=Araneus ventricosus TaxID=182803 RepID=A0A4Y2J1F1_ARAVE|nr:hypothetical protein AVEN_261316-1 [Araneus ventricosus]